MMPGGAGPQGGGGRGGITSRQPPSWSPERETWSLGACWPPTWTAPNNALPSFSTSVGPLASARAR
eukprot:8486499-Pyramimonas_sp.AAC.1